MRPPKYQKFPLFGKESPRRDDSLDRLRKFLGAFMRLSILRESFKFDMIRFIGYWVIAEKPRVGQLGRFFSVHPVGKTMRWIEKWMTSCLMGTTSSITVQSLGKIALGAPAVGAETWCLPAGLPRIAVVFTHRPKIRFFTQQGRLVAPIQVKLCRTDGHLPPGSA